MEKKVIVHVQAYFQPQFGYQEYFLCKSMAKLGHEVHIITSDRFAPFIGFESLKDRMVGTGVYDLDGFKVHRMPILFEKRGRLIIKKLLSKIYQINPDLLILHGTTNFLNLLIFINQKKIKAKIIIDEHHLSIIENKSFFAKIFYSFWGYIYRRLVYDNKVMLVGVAPKCCEFLSNKYKIPISFINLIPLGADTDVFYPNIKKRQKMRKNLNIKNEETLVIYTGKINTEKDPFLIIKALKESKDIESIKFIFIGSISKNYMNNYKSLLNSNKIIIHPAVDNKELPNYYNAADIACWPKHTSLSSLEASSCGLPVIISETVKERVNYDNGISIRDENLKDIREAIIKLSLNKDLRIKMGLKGVKFIKNNYSYEYIAKQFINLNHTNLGGH